MHARMQAHTHTHTHARAHARVHGRMHICVEPHNIPIPILVKTSRSTKIHTKNMSVIMNSYYNCIHHAHTDTNQIYGLRHLQCNMYASIVATQLRLLGIDDGYLEIVKYTWRRDVFVFPRQ